MQRNNTPILIGTILFGLLALGVTVVMFLKPPAPQVQEPTGTPTPLPPQYAWVARRNIPPRVTVELADLEKQKVKPAEIPGDAVTDLDQVKLLVTKAPITEGQTLSLGQFEKPLARVASASMEVPPGFVGVGVWVDPDQTAAGLVDIGDRVDVVATHRLSWDKAPSQYYIGASNFTEGRTIGRNLLVLGVKKSLDAPPPVPTPVPGAPVAPAPAPTPAPAPNPGAGPQRTRVILAAKSDVAASLIAANDMGTLHLVIRNPNDTDVVPVKGAREYPSRLVTIKPVTEKSASDIGKSFADGYVKGLKPILDAPSAPALPPAQPVVPTAPPAAPPAPTEKEVTIIRGTEKTRAVVPR